MPFYYLAILFLIISGGNLNAQSCGTPGSIERGSSSLLDLNSDGFFSIYNNSGFTVSSNEFNEFEALAQTGGANLGWTRLLGNDPNDDLQSGGGCGNTDITNDADGGSDYAYYSIVDPNGTIDDGDEYLVFALRMANKVNGNFGFSFLLDSDDNCGTGDGNAVCGNSCFEYEIQLSTSNSGGSVDLYNVDGCYGTSNCNTVNSPSATICTGCNTGGIQVCAGSSACTGSDPVFWVFYIHFSQIPSVNSSSVFSLTPASNTSGNAIVYKSANVSDFGGVDDINDLAGTCDCVNFCSGSGCSKCEQDCLLSCAAEENVVDYNPTFPVEMLGFESRQSGEGVQLIWTVMENATNQGYFVERAKQNESFQEIHFQVPEVGDQLAQYTFFDIPFNSGTYIYRIKQVDIDGKNSYSSSLEIDFSDSKVRILTDQYQRLLHLNNLPIGPKTVEIYAISNQLLLQQSIGSKADRYDISTEPLPAGVYLVQIKLGGKLILQQKILQSF
ncbi:MAG: T9SS type A sorting domain-containing protein [Bacteroidia bacterium]